MTGTNPAAGLAKRAIGYAGGEVGLDGVKGADFDALVAVDAGVFDLAFADAEQVADREHGAAGADIFAPETGAQKSEGEDAEEERDGDKMADVHRGDQVPAAEQTGL